MKKLTALLIGLGALTFGCAGYPGPDHEQGKQREAVDVNRNGVPDRLETKAVPLEPVVARPVKSAE